MLFRPSEVVAISYHPPCTEKNNHQFWWDTVDGKNPAPVDMVVYPCLSHSLQGFIFHPRWLFGISEPSTVR